MTSAGERVSAGAVVSAWCTKTYQIKTHHTPHIQSRTQRTKKRKNVVHVHVHVGVNSDDSVDT